MISYCLEPVVQSDRWWSRSASTWIWMHINISTTQLGCTLRICCETGNSVPLNRWENRRDCSRCLVLQLASKPGFWINQNTVAVDIDEKYRDEHFLDVLLDFSVTMKVSCGKSWVWSCWQLIEYLKSNRKRTKEIEERWDRTTNKSIKMKDYEGKEKVNKTWGKVGKVGVLVVGALKEYDLEFRLVLSKDLMLYNSWTRVTILTRRRLGLVLIS